jgi:hypothetical protein
LRLRNERQYIHIGQPDEAATERVHPAKELDGPIYVMELAQKLARLPGRLEYDREEARRIATSCPGPTPRPAAEPRRFRPFAGPRLSLKPFARVVGAPPITRGGPRQVRDL